MNYSPAVNPHSTRKIYADNIINEPTLVRNNQDNNIRNNKLANINSKTINSETTDDDHAAKKAHVDSSSEKDRNRRELPSVFNEQNTKFQKKQINKLRKYYS